MVANDLLKSVILTALCLHQDRVIDTGTSQMLVMYLMAIGIVYYILVIVVILCHNEDQLCQT